MEGKLSEVTRLNLKTVEALYKLRVLVTIPEIASLFLLTEHVNMSCSCIAAVALEPSSVDLYTRLQKQRHKEQTQQSATKITVEIISGAA